MKILALPSALTDKKNVTDIVLDTTGLKVYGAGEWRKKRYGGKRRWKKLCGGDLKSRCETRKAVEVQLKAQMINEMIEDRVG